MPGAIQSTAKLRLTHALALGALHGPAELLPISSSGHVTLIPWLLSWDYQGSILTSARPLRWHCMPVRLSRC